MVMSGVSLMAVVLISCSLVVDTEQHWKWRESHNRDSPVKYLYPIHSYKSPYAPSIGDKSPFAHIGDKSPLAYIGDKSPYARFGDRSPYAYISDRSPYSHFGEKSPYASVGEKSPFKSDRCELRKVVFTQNAHSPQYVAYKTKIPDLKEFTLCHWHNIFNYTHDQPIFSYTLPGKYRVIYSWIENSPQKTYYSLAINGHTIYRINYPEKLFKWYHVCQSWNGRTGEWQLWVNTERVGRGFYNLMAGKPIKGGGVAISGREYLEQALAAGGASFSGELTLVTLYKAALTAGKAWNNHKHHHVHNFHHGYDESVDEADTEAPEPAAAPEATRPPHLAHGNGFVNGQREHKLPVPGAAAAAAADDAAVQHQLHQHQLFAAGGLFDFYTPLTPSAVVVPAVAASDGLPADESFRVNLLDRNDERFKRNATVTRAKRWTPVVAPRVSRSDGVAAGGHDRKREPAEWEVQKVAGVCAACETDPFAEAVVLSWHHTRKQFYNGALYLPALPKCYMF